MDFITSSLLGGLVYDAVKVYGGKVTDMALNRLYENSFKQKIDNTVTNKLVDELNNIDYSAAASKDDITALIELNQQILNHIREINTEISKKKHINVSGDVYGNVIGTIEGDYVQGDKIGGNQYNGCTIK